MSVQTLHKIETGGTKSVSPEARRKVAPVLGVPEEVLIMPIGSPIPPVVSGAYNVLMTDDTARLLLLEVKLLVQQLAKFQDEQSQQAGQMIDLLQQILARLG
jgi:transcriptional regulator with XRE-family HTH domain